MKANTGTQTFQGSRKNRGASARTITATPTASTNVGTQPDQRRTNASEAQIATRCKVRFDTSIPILERPKARYTGYMR